MNAKSDVKGIKILIGNLRCFVVNGAEAGPILHPWLTVKHPTPWLNPLWRKKIHGIPAWDGRTYFYNTGGEDEIERLPPFISARLKPLVYPSIIWRRLHTFPTGLLPVVLRHAHEAGVHLELEDRRGLPPTVTTPTVQGITLRDYQDTSIHRVIEGELCGLTWPRGIVQLPTRAGKTAVIAGVANAYSREFVIVLTKGTELLRQTAKELTTLLGERIGIIGDGDADIERVTVASIPTLYEYMDEFRPYFKVIRVKITDECHHLGSAATWQHVSNAIPAYVCLGVSATPYNPTDPTPNYRLSAATGDIVYKVSPKTLIDREIVSNVRIRYTVIDRPAIVRGEDGESYASWSLPWRRTPNQPPQTPLAYESIIVRNVYRNEKIVEFCEESDRPTLVIVNHKEHGELLAQKLGCTFVTGDETSTMRATILEKMAAGRLRHLVATPIYDEGITAPAIERLSLAAGMKSETKLLQRIGRGMQQSPGKPYLLVQDFLDSMNKHTARQSEERVRTAAAAGFEILDMDSAA